MYIASMDDRESNSEMITRLEVAKEDIDKLKDIAKQALPLEACALLYGTINGSDAKVDGIIQLRNVADSSVRFMIDPDEYYQVYRRIRAMDKELVAIFHAHPSKAEPSRIDLEYMKVNQIPWLIISSIDYSYGLYAYYSRLEKLELAIT